MGGVTGEQDWYISGVFSMSFINLNDTFEDYIDRAGLVPKVNAAEDALIPSDAEIDSHAVRHKDGGPDELDVSDLAGVEGTIGQVPETDGAAVTWVNLAHGNLSGVSYNDHHSVGTGIIWDVDNNVAHNTPAVHEAGGALEIAHNNLALASDDHHAKYTDSEAIAAINNDADHGSTAQHDYFSGDHADLSNVLADQHHAKYTDSEAIAAIEGHINIFTEPQIIELAEGNLFLKHKDKDASNSINYYIESDGIFWIRGYRANDGTYFDFASFHPAAGYWELNFGLQIGQSKLKTSYGSVSTESITGVIKTLPGGPYGFYPQLRTDYSPDSALWGFNYSDNKGEAAARTDSTAYATSAFICTQGATAYMRQRYVTSSGEVHWVFILRCKSTKKIVSVWQAPDHPCFGNGGNPDMVDQPHGDFDPKEHDLIVINPTPHQVRAINRACLDEDGMDQGKDFIEAMFELFEIITDSSVEWPSIPVTVGLTSDFADKPRQPVKRCIKKHPQAIIGKLHAQGKRK